MTRSSPACAVFVALALITGHGRCSDRPGLETAFEASFGGSAPLSRTVRSNHSVSHRARPDEAFVVRPQTLIELSKGRYALISFETLPSAGHSDGGQIAVSYLRQTAAGWVPEKLWPEWLQSGVGGEPANAGDETKRFGSDPLYIARSAWCGMGECSEWLGVIRLSESEPVAYDDVLAGAIFPTEGSPVLDYYGNTCRNYDLKARLDRPRVSGSLFSIIYRGWTSPPGALTPKRPLNLVTDFVPSGGKLVMRPPIPVPTCGR